MRLTRFRPSPMTQPPFLQPNDKIGLISLASKVEYEDLQAFIHIAQNDWGLQVVEGNHLKNQNYQFAGTDQERLSDFQTMLNDDAIKAIFSSRGGYGSSRIIDQIDFRKFKKNPKWIVGFSDITAVHCHLNNLGFQSIHSIVPKQFGNEAYLSSIESLRKILFGQKVSYETPSHHLNRTGNGVGELVGGNLCLLAHLMGSKSEVKTKSKILFVEDVNEYLYNIDRMMVQLKRAKKLDNLAGLVVGKFTDSKDNESSPFGKNAYEIISEHVSGYDFPVCYDFPIGHEPPNFPIIVGAKTHLSVGLNSTVLSIIQE